MNSELKKIIIQLTSFLLIAFIAIVVGGYFWLKSIHYKNFKEAKFDSQIWKRSEEYKDSLKGYEKIFEDYKCIRGKMYDDLQKNYLKKGMAKEELENLLGISNKKRIYKTFFGTKLCIQYSIGECAPGPTDIMLVCLGKNNEVKEYFLSDVNDDGEEINN